MRASIVTHALDANALASEIARETNGATAIFLGTVRSTNEGREVRDIEYSAYTEMAEAEMKRIMEEALHRFGISDAVVEHRIGSLSVGDASVAVAVTSPHRAAAVDSLRYIVDETKKRAPIWKLEHYNDGKREWVNAGSGTPA